VSIQRLAPIIVLSSLVAFACGGDDGGSTGPDPNGSIEVSLAISGESLDADGCLFTVDGASSRRITDGESTTYTSLAVGQHEVAISDVAGNCQVFGDVVRSVAVVGGQTATVTFALTCSALAGSIAISASTTGEDLDADGYEILVDGGAPSAIGINGSMTAGGLAPGDYSVELQDEAFNCNVAGNNPRIVTVTAGAETQITFDVTCKYHLYDRIAFASNRSGDYRLYSVTIAGPSSVRDLDLAGSSPAVSPDGLKIAFSRGDDIWIADADGSNSIQLTSASERERDPAWSADGERIAFMREYQELQIWIMNADGSSAAAVADGRDPTWSPDGTRIAFVTHRTGDPEIFVMNADGSGQTNLTSHTAFDSTPAWSPLGNYIAFMSDRDGPSHIFVVDPAGGVPINLTQGIANMAWSPTWAPGAVAGAYVEWDGLTGDIYYFVPGAAGSVRLTNDPADDASPSWGGGN